MLMNLPAWGVYVHIPWCRTRCPYCAFTIVVDRDSPKHAYTLALLRQWQATAPRFPSPPTTLAFGGGTPSLHPPEDLAAIIRTIQPSGEVSLEANPGQVNAALLGEWRDAGVTRVSVGVQTFSRRHARLLNRGHTVEDAQTLLGLVAEAGFRSWSADLIFATPGQTLDELDADLDALLATSPPHVSLYGLTAEEGTPYGRAVADGRITPADDQAWRAAYERVVSRLEAEGLARYEVSNFARPGHRSAHNEHYWRGRPYAGLGVGAAGYWPDGARTQGPEDVAAYLADPVGTTTIERPSPEDAAVDWLVGTSRHIDGLSLEELAARGFTLREDVVRGLVRAGLLTKTSTGLGLTPAGFPVADGVLRRLADALAPLGG